MSEHNYQTDKPEFSKAHVRIYGVFDEDERCRIANHHDIAGNLVVTIREDRIEVAFDQSDHVYTALIMPVRGRGVDEFVPGKGWRGSDGKFYQRPEQ